MIEKIEQVTRMWPDRKAIVSGRRALTYKELWTKSQALGVWLEEKLGDDKTPVVVYGHKDPMMLVCFLACVRTGRAYCPVDISMPHERISDICDAVNNKVVLATEAGHGIEKYEVAEFETIEEICKEGSDYFEKGVSLDTSLSVKPEDTYYIIFTSGSTGKPKGVEIPHSALSNYTDWSVGLGSEPEVKQGATFLNQAPFSFDLSVMDVYTSLASGGTIFCLTKELQKDMASMLEAIKGADINFWVSTPSFADMCLADANFDSGLMPNLKAFLFCGEKLTKETAGKLMERFPESKVINTYGPTESTVAVTDIEITKEMLEDEKELPIGRVKPGTEIEIAEENNELLILGDTLSKGYFRNPEKTAEAFFIDKDGKRKYRTGDEGFYVGDVLYYRGRIDLQIKLHGYRIELGDIEANLTNIDGIEAAAVIPKKNEGKIRYLVGFVVKPGAEGSFKESKKIKNLLKKSLPEYMVPKKITFVDSLPLTPNGKTDRRKLEEQL